MSNLQEILNIAKKRYGVTDPSLERKTPEELEALWIKAKQEVVKKNPLEWFDLVLNENLEAGLAQVKTVSDLRYFGYLQKQGDEQVLERLKKTYGEFFMTIRVNEKDPSKSCVTLYNQKKGDMFRYPDWHSYLQRAEDEKKHKKNNDI